MQVTERRLGSARVVITGMGVVTTIGECLADYREALLAGRSGITHWKNMDERIDSKIGGDMSDFSAEGHFERCGVGYPAQLVQGAQKILRATPVVGHMVLVAALQAFLDAGLPDPKILPERIGHILGGHNLNGDYIVRNVLEFKENPEYIDPLYGFVVWDTDVLAKVAELLCLKGPCYTLGNACASGNVALLSGLDLLRAGRADAVVVTAASQGLDPVLLQGWALMNAISWRSFNDEPWRASRPFDARREGFLPSEGAAAVVLETLKSARRRGARVYAELLGASSASDATRFPTPIQEGQARVMGQALRDAGLPPDRIDYVNAHATSTPLGDGVEVASLKQVFGERAYHIPVNSTKSMLGHCLTASGLVEFVATVLEMEHGFVHATINQEEPDPKLDLDFVPNEARPCRIRYALSNSFGFGGLNSSVVVGKVR